MIAEHLDSFHSDRGPAVAPTAGTPYTSSTLGSSHIHTACSLRICSPSFGGGAPPKEHGTHRNTGTWFLLAVSSAYEDL
jgi:hypothetical protein